MPQGQGGHKSVRFRADLPAVLESCATPIQGRPQWCAIFQLRPRPLRPFLHHPEQLKRQLRCEVLLDRLHCIDQQWLRKVPFLVSQEGRPD